MSKVPEIDFISTKPGWHFHKSSGGTLFGRLLSLVVFLLASLYLLACVLP